MEVLSFSLAPPKKMGVWGCSMRQYSRWVWGTLDSATLRGRPRRETTGAAEAEEVSRRIGVPFLKAEQSSLRERVKRSDFPRLTVTSQVPAQELMAARSRLSEAATVERSEVESIVARCCRRQQRGPACC